MARSLGTAVENNFTGGLVTEATSLNFPENAVTDTDNCVFDKSGFVYRRPGMDYEQNFQFLSITRGADFVTNSYLWKNAGGNGEYVICVIQNGSYLYFFRSTNGSISKSQMPLVYDIAGFSSRGGLNPASYECQFAVGNGYLLVTNPACNPFYVSYDIESNSFGVFPISIGIRDFEGATDPENRGIEERALDLNIERYYNLYNQGWTKDKMDIFRLQVGGWPSRADVWWLLKDSNGNFKPGRIETQVPVKDTVQTVYGDIRANSVYRGASPAPTGHHILSPFFLDRSSASGIPNIPLGRTTNSRPSTVGFYAGRVFYSGVIGPSYTDKIYFSQVLDGAKDFGKCYQVNDPTSESLFNLLATDGGVISIPEAGQIMKMIPVATSLLVFATNGIWAIGGSTGIGFAANDYSVSKVSSIPVTSPSSFVDIEGFPAFWNDEAIYMVSAGQAGNLQVQSMTEKKIKTFYGNIPLDSKKYAKGYYNPTDKTIQWIFRDTTSPTITSRYNYNRALVYNILIESWYPWTFKIPEGSELAGVVTTYGSELRTTEAPVTALDSSYVTTTTSTIVTSSSVLSAPVTFVYKYLLFTPAGFLFTDLNPGRYVDFRTEEYSSYFTTGYKLRGEAVKKAQTNYLIVFFKKQYGSQFSVRALWDYSNSGQSGRWSSKQLINSGRGHEDYDYRRLKVRGQGRAVQYKYESVGQTPFNISGWATVDSVNGSI